MDDQTCHANFYVKPELFEIIRKARGWQKRGFDTRLAREIGKSKATLSLIKNGKLSIQLSILWEVLKSAGMGRLTTDEHGRKVPLYTEWGKHIYISEHDVHVNHPMNNMEKYNGERPYSKYSHAAAIRRMDGDVEEMTKLRHMKKKDKSIEKNT